MHRSRHVVMHQAYELEVAGSWKSHGVGLPVHQFAGGHARGAIEAGAIGRCSWTAPAGDAWARRSDLLRGGVLFQEGHRMDLGGGKCPGDPVASVNPKLIRQEGQSLYSLVSTLGARDSLPRCGPNRPWNDQNRQNQHAADDG